MANMAGSPSLPHRMSLDPPGSAHLPPAIPQLSLDDMALMFENDDDFLAQFQTSSWDISGGAAGCPGGGQGGLGPVDSVDVQPQVSSLLGDSPGGPAKLYRGQVQAKQGMEVSGCCQPVPESISQPMHPSSWHVLSVTQHGELIPTSNVRQQKEAMPTSNAMQYTDPIPASHATQDAEAMPAYNAMQFAEPIPASNAAQYADVMPASNAAQYTDPIPASNATQYAEAMPASNAMQFAEAMSTACPSQSLLNGSPSLPPFPPILQHHPLSAPQPGSHLPPPSAYLHPTSPAMALTSGSLPPFPTDLLQFKPSQFHHLPLPMPHASPLVLIARSKERQARKRRQEDQRRTVESMEEAVAKLKSLEAALNSENSLLRRKVKILESSVALREQHLHSLMEYQTRYHERPAPPSGHTSAHTRGLETYRADQRAHIASDQRPRPPPGYTLEAQLPMECTLNSFVLPHVVPGTPTPGQAPGASPLAGATSPENVTTSWVESNQITADLLAVEWEEGPGQQQPGGPGQQPEVPGQQPEGPGQQPKVPGQQQAGGAPSDTSGSPPRAATAWQSSCQAGTSTCLGNSPRPAALEPSQRGAGPSEVLLFEALCTDGWNAERTELARRLSPQAFRDMWLGFLRFISIYTLPADIHGHGSAAHQELEKHCSRGLDVINQTILLNPDAFYSSLYINLSTGKAERPADGFWRKVARCLHVTDSQIEYCRVAMGLLDQKVSQLLTERCELAALLSRKLTIQPGMRSSSTRPSATRPSATWPSATNHATQLQDCLHMGQPFRQRTFQENGAAQRASVNAHETSERQSVNTHETSQRKSLNAQETSQRRSVNAQETSQRESEKEELKEEEISQRLDINLFHEHSAHSTVSDFLTTEVMTVLQIARASSASFPFIPDVTAILQSVLELDAGLD